jgi:hypothetical protein
MFQPRLVSRGCNFLRKALLHTKLSNAQRGIEAGWPQNSSNNNAAADVPPEWNGT